MPETSAHATCRAELHSPHREAIISASCSIKPVRRTKQALCARHAFVGQLGPF